jgi:DnaK suppressor protein
MFASLFQWMGFPSANPLHSRAKESALIPVAMLGGEVVKAPPVPAQLSQRQDKPARRTSVKASDVKPIAKPAKARATVKAVKPVPPARLVKSKPEPAAKAITKPAAKSPAKPTPQVAPKPVAQKGIKVSAKSAPKAQTVTPAPKPKAAGAAPAPSTLAPLLKKKNATVTTVVKPAAVVNASKPVKVTSPAAPVAVAAPPSAGPQLSPLGVPVRSGRPSSRLAQLTVPSMAQSVASTAAKSSFTQMVTVQPIVSPLPSAIKKDPKLANNWKKKAVAELTADEVLAMSDQEYMNETQMAYFRLKLLKLKNDILSNAGETTEHLREDTVVVPDPADRATIEEEHALELRTRDRERKLLKKIDQSINRIDAGDYGYCDETGEAIGVGRLLARPTATLSLEAQQRRELKQKMYGD